MARFRMQTLIDSRLPGSNAIRCRRAEFFSSSSGRGVDSGTSAAQSLEDTGDDADLALIF